MRALAFRRGCPALRRVVSQADARYVRRDVQARGRRVPTPQPRRVLRARGMQTRQVVLTAARYPAGTR